MRRTILPRENQIFPGGQRFEALKELVFSNDTGTITLFTVTGDVQVYLVAICKMALASVAAANISLGIVGNTNAMLVDTLATELDANEFWNDQSPTDEIQTSDRIRKYDISNGKDIVLTLDDQIDSGALTFYCYFTPYSGNGLVVAV